MTDSRLPTAVLAGLCGLPALAAAGLWVGERIAAGRRIRRLARQEARAARLGDALRYEEARNGHHRA